MSAEIRKRQQYNWHNPSSIKTSLVKNNDVSNSLSGFKNYLQSLKVKYFFILMR